MNRFNSTVLLLIMISALSHFNAGAQLLPYDLLPLKDYYYLKNWSVNGDVKSLKIRRFQPRNPGDRFSTFEACRKDAFTRTKYFGAEDYFLFNRKGQLVRRTLSTPTGNETTMYEYNYFDKISAITSLSAQVRFGYDMTGKLISRYTYEGAKVVVKSDFEYRGDTSIMVTRNLITNRVDSLIEVRDSTGRLYYSASKPYDHYWNYEHLEYDSLGRLVKNFNSNDLFFEYQYDEAGRVSHTYVGRDKSFLSITTYDDHEGICRTSRCEMLEGQYVERNYDCLCTAIDELNNPIRREFIDCSRSGTEQSFSMSGFIEVEYSYFK